MGGINNNSLFMSPSTRSWMNNMQGAQSPTNGFSAPGIPAPGMGNPATTQNAPSMMPNNMNLMGMGPYNQLAQNLAFQGMPSPSNGAASMMGGQMGAGQMPGGNIQDFISQNPFRSYMAMRMPGGMGDKLGNRLGIPQFGSGAGPNPMGFNPQQNPMFGGYFPTGK
jgi:hypothetical protein